MKTARMFVLALGLISLAAAEEINRDLEVSNRIFGGTKVRPGEMPFMAAVFYNGPSGWSFRCGGSIIDKSYILTAAHCFLNRKTGKLLKGLSGNIQVQVGCLDLHGCNSGRFSVSKIMIHPKFIYSTRINDIAIIKLTDPINLDHESTDLVVLADDKRLCCDEKRESLTVAGWGIIESGKISEDLLKVHVKSIPLRECREFRPQIDNRMICAGNEKSNFCQGDDGGPLLKSTNIQVGIVSVGLGGECDANGGAYTKVAHFLSWIAACLVGNCPYLPLE